MNKKLKELARCSALSYKAQESAIVVVEDFSFEAPKTKEFVSFKKNINVAEGARSLVVLPDYDKNMYLSARNVERSEVTIAANLNTYEIMKAKTLVLFESTIEQFGKLENA